jgi:hypothetical protein
MFIIFGSPRSGTTLIAQCLSCHPKIIVPNETDFIVPMCMIVNRVDKPKIGKELIYKLAVNSKASSSILEYLSKEQIREVINSSRYEPSAILINIYNEIAKSQKKAVAGDKSPNDLNYINLLRDMLKNPNIKVIHVIRDVRDVVTSLIKTGWVKNVEKYFPRLWSNNNLLLNWSLSSFPKKYILIRYRDFVTQPEQELKKISHFLDLSYSERMLNPSFRNARYKGNKYHRNIYKAINDRSVGSYQKSLDSKQLKLISKQAAEGVNKFYPDIAGSDYEDK